MEDSEADEPPKKKRRVQQREKPRGTSTSGTLVETITEQLCSDDSEPCNVAGFNPEKDSSLRSHLTETCEPFSNSSSMQLEPSQLDESLMFVPQNAIERSWKRYSRKLTSYGLDEAAYQDCLAPIFRNFVSFWNLPVSSKSLATTLQSGNYVVFVDLLKNPDLSIADLHRDLNADTPLIGIYNFTIIEFSFNLPQWYSFARCASKDCWSNRYGAICN